MTEDEMVDASRLMDESEAELRDGDGTGGFKMPLSGGIAKSRHNRGLKLNSN